MSRLYPLLLIWFSVQVAWAQPEISLGDVSATAGSQVAVPVNISAGAGITAIQFSITFQTDVLSVAQGGVLAGAALKDHSIGSSQENGTLSLVIFSGSLSPLNAGPGTLLNILFDVAPTASAGTTNLTLSAVQTSDRNGFGVSVDTRDGTVSIGGEASAPGEGENELLFAQMANGTFAGGSFGVILVFVNRTGAPASAEVRFFKSDGTPFTLGLTDGRIDSQFNFPVAAGGSAFLRTDGSGDLAAGYARLSTTAPLGGTLLFASRDPSGTILTEAGVGASPLAEHFSVPVLFEADRANTGIALLNASGAGVEITLILKDEDGMEMEQTVINLANGEHRPRFATEFFEAAFGGRSDFQGSIEVWASAPIAAIALKQQGALLTTFPVVVLE